MRTLALALGLVLAGSTPPLAAQAWQDDLTLVTINPGQNLPGVVGVRHAGDGTDRLFAIVRTGQIRIFDANRVLQTTPFLSFQANSPPLGFTQVGGTSGDERGLLGLAFHPLYASNGKFYVYYLDGSSNSVVTEYTVSAGNPNVADPTSARVILRVYQPYTNHNGGDIHFGADGYLYVGLGDGGSGNDPCNSGQSLTSGAMSNNGSCTVSATFLGTPPTGVPRGQADSRALLGKMLRIDVDNTSAPANADLCGIDPANVRYGIPADNPFAGDAGGDVGACDEIYHYGLRNPYRFSFDRDTHDLIIGDVGQSTFEEVDLVGPAGGHNFGWKLCEGFHARGSETADCPLATATDPILAYNRDEGISITGGFRYRGPYAALDGVLFFADAYFNRLFYATETGGSWSWDEFTPGSNGTIVGFGEDEAGHLYLTTLAGAVRRFTMAEPPAAFTVTQSASGTPEAGETVTVTIGVTNAGSETIDDINVTATLQGGASAPAACQATSLPATATTQCEVTHSVTQAQFDAHASLTHAVDITGTLPDATPVTFEDDSFLVPLAAAAPDANLGLSSTSGGPVGVGDPIAVRAQVTNLGNVTLNAIVVTNATGGTATCDVTTIAPWAPAICILPAYTITQADVDAGSILETITFTSSSARGGPVTDTRPIVLSTELAAPAVVATLAVTALTDADGDGLVEPGDTVRIAATAENDGNVTLTDVTVSAVPGGLAACAATLAPDDAAVACATIDYVVQAADVVDGTFRVEAVVSGEPPQELPRVESDAVEQVLDGEVELPAEIFADGFEGAPDVP